MLINRFCFSLPHQDKHRERIRYDKKANQQLINARSGVIGLLGAAGIQPVFRAPYTEYEEQILTRARKGTRVLDLCCGSGMLSLIASPRGAKISVADISKKNVELACLTARLHGISIEGKSADAESLPYPDCFFDLVTCAGSLSYFDRKNGLREISRVLAPGGYFICVDSLNHNPFYQVNRWLNYFRKNRTITTIIRMPNMKTFKEFELYIGNIEYIKYFGIFSFLIPMLQKPLGPQKTAAVIDRLDKYFYFMRRYAFKFVAVVQKK